MKYTLESNEAFRHKIEYLTQIQNNGHVWRQHDERSLLVAPLWHVETQVSARVRGV